MHYRAAAADDGPRVGSFAETYSLGEQLGDGSYATVHKATAWATGETVAVKRIKKACKLRDVRAEMAFVRSLSHPSIVSVHDFFVESDAYYVVMELVRGGDLYDRLHKKGVFPEEKVRALVYNLLTAVHHCHARKVIHRDLKPENVLLVDDDSDVHIKLADFGFAAKVSSKPLVDMCGTAGYAAPEIAKGLPYSTPVDIWSIGVIMFVLITGNLPFGTDRETFRGMCPLSRPPLWYHPYFWSVISHDAKRCLERMLVVEPGCRATADELLDDPWFFPLKAPAVEAPPLRYPRFRRSSTAFQKYVKPLWKRVSGYLPRRQAQEFTL